jgi:di/tripeptidase
LVLLSYLQHLLSEQKPGLIFTAAAAAAAARSHFHSRSQISLSQQEPDLSKALLQLQVTKDAFQQLLGKEPKVAAIHAGLECGIIGEKVPGMDAVSYGPTITGAHSPDEQVSRQLHLQIMMQSTKCFAALL